MPSRRGTALVAFVLALAVVQVVVEDVLVFLGATGTDAPAGFLSSPYVLVGVPLVLFLLLAGTLLGWAILSDDSLR